MMGGPGAQLPPPTEKWSCHGAPGCFLQADVGVRVPSLPVIGFSAGSTQDRGKTLNLTVLYQHYVRCHVLSGCAKQGHAQGGSRVDFTTHIHVFMEDMKKGKKKRREREGKQAARMEQSLPDEHIHLFFF